LPGQALEEPQLGLQIGPNIKLNLLLVVGLMGGGAAFREMTDDIRTSEELAGCPLLGMTPELAQDKADHQLAFRQAASHGTLDDSSIHWPPSWESLDLIRTFNF